MIKVKLIEKTKNKNGEIKREVKLKKEIKKNKNYKKFISELSNSFSITKNKFILIALTEDEDENPINDQNDLDSYIDETKEFMIIMEEGSIKTKPDKKTKEKEKEKKNSDSENDDDKNDNHSNKDRDEKKEIEDEEEEEEEEEEDYLNKINIKVNFEILEQEIEEIMNSVKMPEIDNINDDIEFDIEKYKESLNNYNNTKIEDFKKVFENEFNSLITQKSTIIKNEIIKLNLNTEEDQKKNRELIEEETKAAKEEFKKIVEDTNEMNNANNENNKNQMMIKFKNEEINHEISIKKAKFFEIENIKISNIGNKSFTNLFFEIDPHESSKDLLFYENTSKNNNRHKLCMNGPLQRGDDLNNIVTFYIKEPKIGKYTIYIYVRENNEKENLSSPLKINVNLIEDPDEKRKREEAEKNKNQPEIQIQPEIKNQPEIQIQPEIKNQPEIQIQPEIKNQPEIQVQPEIKNQPEIQIQPEIKNQPEIQIQPEIKNQPEIQIQPEIYEIFGNLNIDYKDQDPKKVQKMLAELVDEFNLLSFLDAEDIIQKIIETKCDREKMNDWINDSL